MKKLIKMYRSTDQKLIQAGLKLNAYGQFLKIMRTIVCGNGINEVEISKIDKDATKKEVTFTFKTAGNYNHLVGEVVNLQDNKDQEYVILEVTNTFIRCEYYDDYNISSNATYTGKVVNSSLGFSNLSDNNDGVIVIADEYKVAKYVFFDRESSRFKDTDQNKIVGFFIQAYDDVSVNAPFDDTGNNRHTNEWNLSANPNSHRRWMTNVTYKSTSEYTIIGNGNFFYIMHGLESFGQKICMNAFGVFKSYVPDDKYNSLFIARAMYNQNGTSSDNQSADSPNAYAKNITMFADANLNAIFSSTGFNILGADTSASAPSENSITPMNHNKQVLRGVSSPSQFQLLPSTNFGSLTCGQGYIRYPNISNKMFLSDTLIYTGNNLPSNTMNINWTIHGKMPFFYWYGHRIETVSANNSVISINDNGKIRKFYVHKNDVTGTVAHIEITPNAYDNYYRE